MMNRIATRVLALFAAAGLSACTDAISNTPAAPPAPSFSAAPTDIGGSWLVRFDGGVPAGFADRVAALGGTVTFAHGGAGIGAVDGLSPQDAADLATLRGVRAVDADDATQLETQPIQVMQATGTDLAADPAGAELYSWQWHLRAIHADQAWAAGRLGSPAVRVGILDTGLDYRHPDLVGRVDLAASKSFIPSQDAIVAAWFPGAHPIADIHYHGTHVGATIASNGVVGAGVTSKTTLVGVRVCDHTGRCPISTVLAGLLYATDQGVDVINISISTRFIRRDSASADGPSLVSTITGALNYAHRKGVTVVVAAGNQNEDLDHDGNAYRAYCYGPHVICVSATGPTGGDREGPFVDVDARAPYSNYGRSMINVAAPGGAAQSVWSACSTFSLIIPFCRTGNFVLGLNGTSMAAPNTAGVAALIVEDVGRNPAQVRARLEQSSDDLGQPGVDPYYGKGRINAARAVGAI